MGSRYEWALLLHLVGVVLFFSGAVVAAAALEADWRRRRAAEIALLLSLTRVGVLLVAAGALLVLPFGLWLVDLGNWGYGSGWVVAALVLLAASAVVGALGGRAPKRARILAWDARTRRRGAANYASGVLALAILALMVFKPGAYCRRAHTL